MFSQFSVAIVLSVFAVLVRTDSTTDQLKAQYLPIAQRYCDARFGSNGQQFLQCYHKQRAINPETHTPEEVFDGCLPNPHPTDEDRKAMCDKIQPNADAAGRDKILSCAVTLIQKMSDNPQQDITNAGKNVDACSAKTIPNPATIASRANRVHLVSRDASASDEEMQKEFLPASQKYCAGRFGSNGQKFLECDDKERKIHPENHYSDDLFIACIPNANPTDADVQNLCKKIDNPKQSGAVMACFINVIKGKSDNPQRDVDNTVKNIDACAAETSSRDDSSDDAMKKEFLPVSQKYCAARFGPNGQKFLECDDKQRKIHPENHYSSDLFIACIPNANPTDADIQNLCKKIDDPKQSDAVMTCFINVIKSKSDNPQRDVDNTAKNVDACAS